MHSHAVLGYSPASSVVPVTISDETDEVLVAAAKSGDRKAFHTLYLRYHRKIYAKIYSSIRNQEDTLDLLQEVFVKAYRYLSGFAGQSAFYTWLYRIASNLCIDHLRKSRRTSGGPSFDDALRHDSDDHPEENLPSSTFPSPAESLSDQQTMAAIQQGLLALSEPHRAVLTLREIHGMSYEEIATSLGCSKGTIMSRLFHARKKMQEQLKERLEYLREDPVFNQEEPAKGLSLAKPKAVTP